MGLFSASSFNYQVGTRDCGPACLRSIAKHYGKFYSLPYLSNLCGISRDGVSIAGIIYAAEVIGLRSLAIKCTLEELENKIPLPAICHWENRHFIIVYQVIKKKSGTQVYVADPAKGMLYYDIADFKEKWMSNQIVEMKGVVLLLDAMCNR